MTICYLDILSITLAITALLSSSMIVSKSCLININNRAGWSSLLCILDAVLVNLDTASIHIKMSIELYQTILNKVNNHAG